MTAASFQSAVNITLSFGVIGELIVDGPQRAEPLTLDSNGGTVGNAFTKSATTNVATMGGTIGAGVVFAGLLANPKAYASFGATNPIDPTLALPGYTQAEFLTMGTIVGYVSAAANIGDLVQFNNTTGALSTVAPTAAFTASQTTTVLTVTGTPTGNIGIGTVVTNAGAIVGTVISLGTGTGGAGTYNLNTSASVGSASMVGNSVATSGNQLVPNAVIYRYPTTAAGLVAIRITD